AASGPAEGLELRILGGATGPRGTVQVTRGVGDLIQSLLEDGGLLNAREEGLQASIQDVQKDRERLAERLQALEARYRAQFTALDTLVAQMKTTSSYLEQQLAKLPG
ncbi:MAG: flagellar hook protein FliD, partial [Gammaproteobacteria bacterium]